MLYVHSDDNMRLQLKTLFIKQISILLKFYPYDYLLLAPPNSQMELIQIFLKAFVNGLSDFSVLLDVRVKVKAATGKSLS